MTDSWGQRLTTYRWRARTAKGWVSVASEDLRRLLDERDQGWGHANRLENECDRLRAEVYKWESKATRHTPIWEKESA